MINQNSKIEQYIINNCEPEETLLYELFRETQLKVLHPRMISGQLQGRLLTMISQMISPKHILEIGTYTGYSAICLAKGLVHGGVLQTIELNDELEDIIHKYFKKDELKNVNLHIGDALKIIPSLNETFDLVFIDGDKTEYLDYYHAVFDKVRKGGFILADNVLWSGKVVEAVDNNDKQTKGLVQFNDFVKNDTRIEKMILPIRDGLFLIRKI